MLVTVGRATIFLAANCIMVIMQAWRVRFAYLFWLALGFVLTSFDVCLFVLGLGLKDLCVWLAASSIR